MTWVDDKEKGANAWVGVWEDCGRKNDELLPSAHGFQLMASSIMDYDGFLCHGLEVREPLTSSIMAFSMMASSIMAPSIMDITGRMCGNRL